MNRENYQQIKQIFQSVLDIAPENRSAFLAEACLDDKDLRRAVEKLIDSFESDYLERPAIGEMAELVVSNKLAGGQIIGHYKISEKIGAGGMGEVFSAEDMRLKRKIALKILPAMLSLDKERLRRFEQEACAASALNHPNILTVHEFGAVDGTIFIASEFVKGETLRNRLDGARFELREALDIAMQVAAALNAAHEQGIIHRDIKPENLMLRDDRLVKVLDFGLAKLIKKKNETVDAEDETLAQVNTTPGLVMGTAAYMSPEQARGQLTDSRSDIWSLGVVLYEMLAGRTPFDGETTSDKIASILKSNPAPLDENMPPELNRIIRKALQKNRDERYQTAKDLLIDLKNLRRELDAEGGAAWQSGVQMSGGSAPPATITNNTAAGQPTNENQPNTSPNTIGETKIRRGIVVSPLAMTLFILLLAAAGFGLYKLIPTFRRSSESFQKMRLTKLTYTGNAADEQVAVSPDGKYVAYTVRTGDLRSLWVKQAATSGDMQIVAPAEVRYGGLAFSRDGNYIFYSMADKNGTSALYQIPVLGVSTRKLIENASGAITISPDGGQIAFVRGKDLMIADIGGSAERLVARASDGSGWQALAWSPDGKIIVTTDFSMAESNWRLVEIEIKDGTKKAIASPPWLKVSGINWLPDGSGLIISARDFETKLSQIRMVTYPEGKLTKVSNDLNNYMGLSLTADGKSLVSIQDELLANIWILPDANADFARQVTFDKSKEEGLSGVAWTSDGRIVYSVRVTGTQDLWIVNEDGSGNRQLTFNERSSFSPVVSPDNRYIVFVSNRSGGSNIWRMDLDGGNPKQLTDNAGISGAPYVSPDGKWVIYQFTAGKTTVWKVSIDGGASVQLMDAPAGRPVISPDGKFFACGYGEGTRDSPMKLGIVPFSGGQAVKVIDLPAIVESRNFRWSSDGKAIIYIDNRKGIYNLWSQPVDGSPPKQLTDLKSDRIFRFDISGRGFALASGHESSDVIMIDNFRE